MLWTSLRRLWRSTILRRTLLPTSRRNLTRSTTLLGESIGFVLLAKLDDYDLFHTSRSNPSIGRHVIVGRNFGSYVTHETKHFIYFYLGQVAILLFKSG
mmetsp:Transcript_9452/g.19774  ORF Transcript_9452/g.19774 Transcript_9452/m.19774 type:complete len:99 (+) Transcript_9452:485-781(+)